ncbi:hypothetical protein K7X08_014854 [Anisodus acutangulus]|uniref:Uncharacterized protein n=1 Tax=Anisodus acutangulus TaxID=402998 RepID=A0A9Q1R1M1_9SOLA|nr:hypothetical protein K7X08_014854 [Anisodus acutangulus]
MELASGSGLEDQVEDQNLGRRAKETYGHCGHGPSVIANRLTSIDDELVVIRKLQETKLRMGSNNVSSSVRSSRKRILKALRFAKAKKIKDNVNFCDIQVRLLILLLIVKIDHLMKKITDVLAQIYGEDDIEEFGDAAQNGYETANEKVV